MVLTLPGTYVLYNEAGNRYRTVPAIVYPDDVAPPHIQAGRPSGYVYATLVLLLEEAPQFRWVTTSQLSPLVARVDVSLATSTDDQQEAWRKASFFKEAGLGLDHWKEEVRRQNDLGALLEPETYSKLDHEGPAGSEEEIDEELRAALRISHLDYYGAGPSILPTPSSSPPSQRRSHRNVISIDDDDDDDDDDNYESLYSSPSQPTIHSTLKRTRLSRIRQTDNSSSSNSLGIHQRPRKRSRSASLRLEDGGTAIVTPKATTRPRFSGGPLDKLLGSSMLNQRSSVPISDAIEGDIAESKDFIRVIVGPSHEVRTLQKKHLWDRPYFRDSRTGTNRFEHDEDNVWVLRHPQLATINIEDFRFIAEFLTDDDFGVRIPDTPEQNKEAIAQCVTTWEVGEKLAMDDLLEHIAEKVKYLEWDKEDVLTLAIMVYRTEGPALPAHNTMRDFLSGLMAHHFWSYIKDEVVGPYFRKRLRRLPELEWDVFEKRAEILRKGEEPDEDEESDEDMLGDGYDS